MGLLRFGFYWLAIPGAIGWAGANAVDTVFNTDDASLPNPPISVQAEQPVPVPVVEPIEEKKQTIVQAKPTAPIAKPNPSKEEDELDKSLKKLRKESKERQKQTKKDLKESEKQMEAILNRKPVIPAPTPIKTVSPVDSRPKCSTLIADCVKAKQRSYGSGAGVATIGIYENQCKASIQSSSCR